VFLPGNTNTSVSMEKVSFSGRQKSMVLKAKDLATIVITDSVAIIMTYSDKRNSLNQLHVV
jgi:hypothetical protein